LLFFPTPTLGEKNQDAPAMDFVESSLHSFFPLEKNCLPSPSFGGHSIISIISDIYHKTSQNEILPRSKSGIFEQ
jgi:hypothetical protein